ncbi:MAG: FAD-dependent oxidoreductase, partial [Opitutaceae bacterium]|nr:FAD-dependent oxidoreductase [Opitutaceae bacterium]
MKPPVSRLLSFLLSLAVPAGLAIAGDSPSVTLDASTRRLVYRADEQGNTIPDFSRAGYHGGGVALPDVAVVRTLEPVAAESGSTPPDDGERIQAALDAVAALPANADGHRGALLLGRGVYRVADSLHVPGGVVLRGEGSGENEGTVIIATGKKRRGLVTVGDLSLGKPASAIGTTPAHIGSAEIEGTRRRVTDAYVPWSTKTLTLEHTESLSVGDRVVVLRPGTPEWIAGLGMDRIVLTNPGPGRKLHQWKAEEYTFAIERFVTAIDAATRRVSLDAPLMIALDRQYGGGWLYRAESRRAAECGVESLRLVSEYKKSQEKKDTDHATSGIILTAVENAWVRDVVALHFNMGFAADRTAIFTTIRDSALLDPVGPIKGGYRYGFNHRGQYGLVENCRTRNTRHAFATSYRTRGPNVFLDCVAELSHTDSGPHERFAIGTLYDNIRESKDLIVQDRGDYGTGHGWAGAQQVFWNCEVAGRIIVQKPPTAQNYAIGSIGKYSDGRYPDRPRGVIESPDKHVQPASLYRTQLAERLGPPKKKTTEVKSDVIIYGGTSAGVIAAVQCVALGRDVVLINCAPRFGGLSSGGLGQTDIGNKSAIGGLAREFYVRLAKHYAQPAAWVWQQSGDYKGKGQSATAEGEPTRWTFEPHVAEKIFNDLLREANAAAGGGGGGGGGRLTIFHGASERLDLQNGVEFSGARIAAIRLESGRCVVGMVFIDASYEGDLMAAANVSHHIGREANRVYGETYNGVQVKNATGHNFRADVPAYIRRGDPASGLLPGIEPDAPADADEGEGDARVQAYNYRVCLTDHPDNRVPFAKPAGYDEKNYELLFRHFEAG